MNPHEIEAELKLRGCSIVSARGDFALVYPHGYGAVKRAHDLQAKTRDAALVEAWLWLHPDQQTAGAVAAVQAIIAADFAMPVRSFAIRDRSEPLSTARRIAMVLCRDLTSCSLQSIGDAFGRNHTAVCHAIESVRDQCETDTAFAARVGTLRLRALTALKSPDA